MVLVLIVAGALFELAGIALALREVRKRRSEVKAHERRPVTGHAAALLSGSGTLTARSAPRSEPPTLGQRVEALERTLSALRTELEESERRAKENARQVADTMTTALRNHLGSDIDSVRTLLLDVTRPTAAVWWSIGLLVVGLGLQTIANVVQVVGSPAGG